MSIEQIFVEQAEYLEDSSFESWNADHPDEQLILRKLTQGGAKLISGPRGCGKTTLLLKAKQVMLSSQDAAFPVYVNYKRSLAIEPLYKDGTNGTFWFNQWVILKLYLGIYDTLASLRFSVELSVSQRAAKDATALLEMSNAGKVATQHLSVDRLEEDLLRIAEKTGRNRCVLLLDDAAHAFSPDQQRDFFDFFRQIKSKSISPKAAVYPGVTSYSSSFHVGHDAEQIDVWVKPDRDEYLGFMKRVLAGRFPTGIFVENPNNEELIDLLCYASFGVPRALLNMLQFITKQEEQVSANMKLNRTEVLSAIKQHFSNTKKLFTSLKSKIPVYAKFIETGDIILNNCIGLVKNYNKGKPATRQSVSIAISEDNLTHELSRVFSLFQYAGLCIPKEEFISRGEKGRFRLYTLHYAGIVDSNALLGGRTVNVSEYVAAFSTRNAHEFTRSRANALLGSETSDKAFALSLPPCSVCQTPRIYEEAAFCAKCGSPLTLPSRYVQLINSDISELPLTDTRIAKIKQQSSIRKIKDILIDHEHTQLLGVDRIGKFWATKISALAEEYVE